MDQAIFDLKLSVEATSAYILLDDVSGSGRRPVELDDLKATWVGGDDSLESALTELVSHGVAQKHRSEYTLLPPKIWKLNRCC